MPFSAVWVSLHLTPPVSSSNNGRRMRENASVSTARPPGFHYYTHKSFPHAPTCSFLFSFHLPCLGDKTWNAHMFERDSIFAWNNRPSRCRRENLCCPGTALTTVIKKVLECRPLRAFFCAFVPFNHSSSASVLSPRVFKYMFYTGVGVLKCQKWNM